MTFIKDKIQSIRSWWQPFFSIYVKECFQIVFSPMYLSILGVCSLLWSFTFVRTLFAFANRSIYSGRGGEMANIHYSVFLPLISQLNLLLIFIIPALTMKLFTEEKKQNTYDLLLSCPITSTQIVLGKFFAVWKATGILIIMSSLYIVLTYFFSDFNWILPVMSYIGICLTAMIYISMSLIAATLTQSVALSMILGIVFNIFIWFIAQSSSLINIDLLTPVLEYLSISDHLLNFAKGTFSTSSFIFFIVISSFFIFLARQIVETSRWR